MDKLKSEQTSSNTEVPVVYEKYGAVAIMTLNRPQFGNAQNRHMLYALDAAFMRAVDDDEVGAIVLCGAGRHFSSGHDLGTPGGDDWVRDVDRKTPWYAHERKPGAERQYAAEQELYLGLCRRWREIPKPTIAAVHGACIAGGLMLAWICDLIVADSNAYFTDPVVAMGIPGVEYFAHAFEMPPRVAREFLMLGEKLTAARAYELGMVNRVVPAGKHVEEAVGMAKCLAERPRFALALTKQAFNLVDDLKGKRNAMEAVFGFHHLAHTHNTVIYGQSVAINSAGGIKRIIGS